MGKVRSRVTIVEDDIDGLRITIANPRRWWPPLFLGLWMVGWATGEWAAIRTFATGHPYMKGGPSPFLALWLTFWTVAGVMAFRYLCWELSGREVIVIDGQSLIYRLETCGFCWPVSFDLAEIRDLRYDPPTYGRSFDWSRRKGSLTGEGSITFDNRGKRRYIGIVLPECEARHLIEVIRGRIKMADHFVV